MAEITAFPSDVIVLILSEQAIKSADSGFYGKTWNRAFLLEWIQSMF